MSASVRDSNLMRSGRKYSRVTVVGMTVLTAATNRTASPHGTGPADGHRSAPVPWERARCSRTPRHSCSQPAVSH